jgi:DNA-binding Lrp family transcriptional regulator
MAFAYVMFWTDSGREENVKNALRKHESVIKADITTGDQDIIALVQGESYEQILNLIVGQLRGMPGVQKTTTNLVLE